MIPLTAKGDLYSEVEDRACSTTAVRQASWSALRPSFIERLAVQSMPSSDGDKDEKLDKPDSQRESMEPRSTPTKGTSSIFNFQTSKDVKKFAKKYRTEIAASTSSVLSTFVAFPLDFAKSRMQSYEYGFVHTVRDAYRAEGIKAFWRGVGPPLLSVTVVRTMSFSIYQKAKYAMDRSISEMTGQSPLQHANAPGSYPSLGTVACFGTAGMAAGAVITTLSCPFELTKLNEQLAGKEARIKESAHGYSSGSPMSSQSGSWATARRLVRDRGFFGLYAGYRLHLLRDVIGTSIYFTTYESVKQLIANARGKNPTSPFAVMIAGGLCGVASWTCVRGLHILLQRLKG